MKKKSSTIKREKYIPLTKSTLSSLRQSRSYFPIRGRHSLISHTITLVRRRYEASVGGFVQHRVRNNSLGPWLGRRCGFETLLCVCVCVCVSICVYCAIWWTGLQEREVAPTKGGPLCFLASALGISRVDRFTSTLGTDSREPGLRS